MTTPLPWRAGVTGALLLLAGSAAVRAIRAQPSVAAPNEYAAAVAELERFIAHEMADKRLPALSIALVDDQRVVWARGFGFANPNDSTPATAETVYRVGSVSKLFTDIGIMQLVERGTIQLDSPVTRYLPDFRPRNPFGRPVTLRQMMAHHSGLVRESPVGHYFDDTAPTLAQTIRSLNTTALVYEPGTRPKYSNAAIAAVGYVLERTQREPFAPYLKRLVLDPLDLGKSSFEPTPAVTRDLAKAYMWTLEGRTFEAPTFQLGMAPAGSMYSTVLDLGRFMSALFAGGQGRAGRVLDSATLEAMWRPQFARPGATSGSGIGFGLSELEGRRLVGHGGAIYGFATELAALPDDNLGAVVATTLDAANSVTDRIAQLALRLMLAVRQRQALPRAEITSPVSPELARRLEGRYGQGEQAVDLIERARELFLLPVSGGIRVALRSLAGDTLVVDDRLTYGPRLIPLGDRRIVVGNDTLARTEAPAPRPIPTRWAGLIGEYGWDHNTLFILERDGKLNALIEWFFMYPLEEVSPDVYKFPDAGLYGGEGLVFTRDRNGRATRVEAASVVFRRRAVGTEAGVTFRIQPVRSVDELRREALAAQPPTETGTFRTSDLVDVASLDSTIRLDIRYATTNNFLGTPLYRVPRAFLQRPAAEALLRAHRTVREQGYGLLIHDAYRPWYITKIFWEAVPEDKRIFVANPADGSRHNRGAAVDLTLYDLKTGRPVEMVGGYDELSERSYPDYPGGTSLQRWHRELLRDAMEEQGFIVYEAEWWHFDYEGWREYPIMNARFEALSLGGRQER
ncbi:MAG: serine hydrolase [Gemmatimonadaceae bacterium]